MTAPHSAEQDPWCLVTWRPNSLMMAEPQWFASHAEAAQAAPADGPFSIVNTARKPARRNRRVLPVIGEIVRRHAREVMPVPYVDTSANQANGSHNTANHQAGLRPLHPPAATRGHKPPPARVAVPPAREKGSQAEVALAGTGTLTATAALVNLKPRRFFVRCVNGHRLVDNWFRDCRGSVCCLTCYREREARKRERAREQRRTGGTTPKRRVPVRRTGVRPALPRARD
jgi:hypothetical protein